MAGQQVCRLFGSRRVADDGRRSGRRVAGRSDREADRGQRLADVPRLARSPGPVQDVHRSPRSRRSSSGPCRGTRRGSVAPAACWSNSTAAPALPSCGRSPAASTSRSGSGRAAWKRTRSSFRSLRSIVWSMVTLFVATLSRSKNVFGLVTRPERQRLVQRGPDEDLLAGDATEVAGRVVLPTSSPSLNCRWRERANASAWSPLSVTQPGCVMSSPVLPSRIAVSKYIGTPPMRVDEVLEAAEVDLDVVVDRDAEVLADRVDEHLPAPAVGRVDAVVLAGVGDRHPQVAWERQHLHRAGDRVDAGRAGSCRSACPPAHPGR